jgi:hypothetical protein
MQKSSSNLILKCSIAALVHGFGAKIVRRKQRIITDIEDALGSYYSYEPKL